MPEKIVFILSTSRTGTKSLAEGLMSEDIFSPHQPPFSRLLTIASNYYLQGWLAKSILEWLVKRLREPQLQKADCKYYVQVFSLDFLPAKIISEKYSNVYIVHIVRDPRTFVPSYLNWMHGRYKSFVANKFVFGWHPSGVFTGEFSWRVWRGMDDFQKVCWHWKYKNALMAHLFEDYDRYLLLRFEDLFSEKGEETLNAMFTFTGISAPDGVTGMLQTKKNLSLKKRFPPWDQWDPATQQQLMDICGQGMRRYGYL